MQGRPSRGERLRGDRVMMSAATLNQPGPRDARVGIAERLLEVIDSGRRTPPANWRC
jgi:hypothetical protein